MCRMLPPWLAELHAAAHTAAHTAAEADRPVVWGLLAEAVRCAHSVGIAVGRNEMSVAALGWMDRAAEHAGDRAPALPAVREYLRVTGLPAGPRLRCVSAAQPIGLRTPLDGTDNTTPDALVARGPLHLGASIISEYTGDQGGIRDHLVEAAHRSELTGERTERLWVGFGPTNVRIHRVWRRPRPEITPARSRPPRASRSPGSCSASATTDRVGLRCRAATPRTPVPAPSRQCTRGTIRSTRRRDCCITTARRTA